MTNHKDFDKELEALRQVLITLEPLSDEQRNFVLKSAAERFGITISKSQNFEEVSDTEINPIPSGNKTPKSFANITPKEFIKEKNPDTDVLRVACLAYYLTYARYQSEFKTEDIEQLNIEAAVQNFGNPLKTVNNAMTRSHFLAPAGRGKKQITAHGEDVVNALPDLNKVAEIIKEHKKGKRAKPKKRKRK